ncbi:hypothetical protein BGZ65_008072 [Modicella reniformis]|uniref:CsbD-like domain-containing protein n=1 Tax=Modicella reniformis TaxID=1440133 RepID=A0A9P6JGK5_9FUNG|nr:hypothetical protein BGZ65_008072 [Modicella reniformis]
MYNMYASTHFYNTSPKKLFFPFHYKPQTRISFLSPPTSTHNIMSNLGEKLSNTVNSYIGGAKQTVGDAIGNPTMAGEGAAQKTQAEVAQQAADAKAHAEGVGNTVQGKLQKATGSLTGNTSLEAKGHANVAKGEIQKNV